MEKILKNYFDQMDTDDISSEDSLEIDSYLEVDEDRVRLAAAASSLGDFDHLLCTDQADGRMINLGDIEIESHVTLYLDIEQLPLNYDKYLHSINEKPGWFQVSPWNSAQDFVIEKNNKLYISSSLYRYYEETLIVRIDPARTVGLIVEERACSIVDESSKHNSPERFPPFVKCDFVLAAIPGISCKGLPGVTNDWQRRTKLKFGHQFLNKCLNKGFVLVPRPSLDGDKDLEWRISFPAIEDLLISRWSEEQDLSYEFIKDLLKSSGARMPLVVTRYHIKTLMFWILEKEDKPEKWKIRKYRESCILGLLDHLIHALATKELKHYIIPERNLLAHIPSTLTERAIKHVKLMKKYAKIEFKGKFPDYTPHPLTIIPMLRLVWPMNPSANQILSKLDKMVYKIVTEAARITKQSRDEGYLEDGLLPMVELVLQAFSFGASCLLSSTLVLNDTSTTDDEPIDQTESNVSVIGEKCICLAAIVSKLCERLASIYSGKPGKIGSLQMEINSLGYGIIPEMFTQNAEQKMTNLTMISRFSSFNLNQMAFEKNTYFLEWVPKLSKDTTNVYRNEEDIHESLQRAAKKVTCFLIE